MSKTGAPSKFKEEYCQMLIDHMGEGLSFESFAAVIDVDDDTLYEWAKVQPKFSEAKRKARAHCRLWWEKKGVSSLHNEYQGKTFNQATWIYNMKCRFAAEWRDNLNVSVGTDDTFTFSKDKKESD